MRKILIPFIALLFATPGFAQDASYIAEDQVVDFTRLIVPPPPPDSDAEQREIAAVLLARAHASEADRARAYADGEISIFRFADMLGPKFREGRRLSKTIALFQRVARDTRPLTMGAKIAWHRDRPFVVDPNVQAPDKMIREVCNDKPNQGSAPTATCPNGVNYSFPSGHSTFGMLTAILLAEMVPEKRDELLRRGWEYGNNRVINGVHFPTDVESGRTAAAIMVVLLMQNPRFRADLADAKAELRAVLALPAN